MQKLVYTIELTLPLDASLFSVFNEGIGQGTLLVKNVVLVRDTDAHEDVTNGSKFAGNARETNA